MSELEVIGWAASMTVAAVVLGGAVYRLRHRGGLAMLGMGIPALLAVVFAGVYWRMLLA